MYRPGAYVVTERAVEVENLVKRYPKSQANAVDGISFSVPVGEIFGLLGPNGAGKTTTVGVLTTRVKPTSGCALVGEVDVTLDPVTARSMLAVVPQRNNLDRALSIRDNLLFHAAYHGVPRPEAKARAAQLLDQFGLADRAASKPEFVSGGQAQRIMIARALMHSPMTLFLDEPSTGLDPAARLFVWERVRALRERGVTIVLTTHDMDEAAELSDRVGIMDHGKLLALDTPKSLTRALPGSQTLDVTVELAGGDLAQAVKAFQMLEGVENVETVDDDTSEGCLRTRLYVSGEASTLLVPVTKVVTDHQMNLTDARIGKPTLEDVFISLTGKALR
ncbi:MAG: ATP-binding cassette domain-containing protein [Actinobacteria bacterium]|nr:ATP-binding cassette domain-containing protein [Actinomycetota bacterium]